MLKKIIPLSLLPVLALGCDTSTDAEFAGAQPDELGAPAGKADGPEYSIRAAGAYDILQVQGAAALDLYGVMDRAGGFERASRGSLDYVYGVYSICVSNGAAAACNLFSRDAREQDGDTFLATTHGQRFDSASSELFGAIARSQGIAPSSLDSVESDRFVCAKESSAVWCGLTAPVSAAVTLELSFDGLMPLGEGYVYEGWLITADGPVTSGRFGIAAGQDTVSMGIDPELAAASTMFVLTIEPEFGDDPAPSDTHVVAGVFEGGQALLDIDHPAALGTDFNDAAGRFFLETPSTADIADDYDQGVWFLDPAAGAPSLDLPTLPAGWVYEGWVVGEDGPVSTGRFVDVAAPDSDAGGPTAGPDATPPFPGQDFIAPPMVLTGTRVVISVEPDPDDGPAPFQLKPLLGDVTDAGPGVLQDLGNISEENRITGLAVLE
ncbi:MAG: anti-sigma factor [Nannocystaceae bacterium]|nr:anti-sigma factor [bacterium]